MISSPFPPLPLKKKQINKMLDPKRRKSTPHTLKLPPHVCRCYKALLENILLNFFCRSTVIWDQDMHVSTKFTSQYTEYIESTKNCVFGNLTLYNKAHAIIVIDCNDCSFSSASKLI